MGVPQNRWLTVENIIKIDDLGVPRFMVDILENEK